MTIRGNLLAISLLLSSATTFAEDFTELVSERQQGFKVMGRNMKVLKNHIKKGDFGSQALSVSAGAIADEVAKISGWFPAGSGMDAGYDSDALSYIWKNNKKFQALTLDMGPAVDGLIAALESGEGEKITRALKASAKACSACHRSFRAD